MVYRSVFLLLLLESVTAFQTVPQAKSPCPLRRHNQILSARRRAEDNDLLPKKSGWDSFKSAIYGGVDSISDLASKLNEGKEKGIDRVEEGYADFEQTLKRSETPGNKIMGEYQARANALGADIGASEKTKTSGFDAFKKGVYGTVDASAKLFGKEEPEPKPVLDRNVPYKRSLAQDLNNEDLISSNPIKRIQAELEIREKEAQRRAQLRNENIRAKKQDLYKLIDSFQATVDSIPEKVEQAEKAAKNASEFVQSVPDKVEKAIADVKAIPTKVKQTATKTKESVEETIETTKKVVEDVKDIPNKVNRKIEDTKRQVEETKESVDETVTKVKVLVGLEKPKPKPPKLPPPKDPTAKQFALDVAGSLAQATGKFAWWVTTSAAGMAWSGAKSAFEKAQESSKKEKPALAPAPPEEIPTVKLPASSSTKEVEQEVADALKLAEASLRKATAEKKEKED